MKQVQDPIQGLPVITIDQLRSAEQGRAMSPLVETALIDTLNYGLTLAQREPIVTSAMVRGLFNKTKAAKIAHRKSIEEERRSA